MVKIKSFVKSELTGWKKREIIVLSFVFLLIIFNAIILKDSIIAVISAFCGILYSTIAGKGKISCYLFGLLGTGCYSWLAYSNALWGNLALYMLYYLPMQIIGIFAWKKHLDKKNEIIKRRLSFKYRVLYFVVAAFCCAIATYLLWLLNDSHPLCDGVATVLSVFAMYFTVKRYIEQWLMWIIVNALSVLMWFDLVLNGAKTYSTLIMWFVYLVLAVYFYLVWKKELLTEQHRD